MNLNTGVDFFLSMPPDDLNDYAQTVNGIVEEQRRKLEEVRRRGKK